MLVGRATAMTFEPLTPERRRQQTRDYLLRAAEQVFARRGFHGATLDEVAALAGFTKGAVYSNFKNKDDLFIALLESRYEENMEGLRAILDSSQGAPEAHLADFAAFVRDEYEIEGDTWVPLDLEFTLYAMRNPDARKKLAAFRRRDLESVARIIAAERERQGIKGAESPDHAARIVVALMRGIGLLRMIDPEMVDESFLEDLMDFFYRAMTAGPEDRSPPTKKRLESLPSTSRPSSRSDTGKPPPRRGGAKRNR
jgi:AcrR family transcriptional regulator